MLEYDDYTLLLDCYEDIDAFSRDGMRYTMTPSEMSSLIVMLDILKPQLKELH
jgi:hypothetical protein